MPETAPTPAPPIARYSRQSALPVIGAAGQRRLAASTIAIVGCGALGSAQAELAARAGVGHLKLIDRDILELHNLQRQLLFDENDVRDRLPKAVAAARRLAAVNSTITLEPVVADLTATTIAELLANVDLVLDGTDNFETRYLLNDDAVQRARPWVYGGVLGCEGTVMAIRPNTGPCLRCLLPDPPTPGDLPTCETQGVFGPAVVWVAALQIAEAFKLLLDNMAAETRLHTLDIWKPACRSTPVARQDNCLCCSQRRFDFLDATLGSTAISFCGRHAVQITPAQPNTPDFARLEARLEPFGTVARNGLLLEFAVADHRLIIFPDGRVLVMGTTDPATARTLVAKYLGA